MHPALCFRVGPPPPPLRAPTIEQLGNGFPTGAWRGTSCAVKRLNLILDKGTSAQFMAEVTMLTRVKHPRVVLFFGVSFHDHDW